MSIKNVWNHHLVLYVLFSHGVHCIQWNLQWKKSKKKQYYATRPSPGGYPSRPCIGTIRRGTLAMGLTWKAPHDSWKNPEKLMGEIVFCSLMGIQLSQVFCIVQTLGRHSPLLIGFQGNPSIHIQLGIIESPMSANKQGLALLNSIHIQSLKNIQAFNSESLKFFDRPIHHPWLRSKYQEPMKSKVI